MAADIRTSPLLSAGRPHALFEGDYSFGPRTANYDVSPDGQRFLMVRDRARAGAGEVNVVLDWFEDWKGGGHRELAK